MSNKKFSALACIAKNENLYILDWINYHLNIGFDTIIINDNNDIGDNSLKHLLQPMISDGTVIYCDCRGLSGYQMDSYKVTYIKQRINYEWIAFFDCDEYLVLEKHGNIKEFLNDAMFDGCDVVHISWMMMGDSGNVHYSPEPVMERFTVPYPLDNKQNTHVKSIIRCYDNQPIRFLSPHHAIFYNKPTVAYNADGERVQASSPWHDITHKTAYLKHFFTMSIEEFLLRRFTRGRASTSKRRTPQELMNQFFSVNTNTLEKQQFIQEFFNGYIIKNGQ